MQKFNPFPLYVEHKKKQQLATMIELIEINYYWTMICIFIVGICYSSKSLYMSSHFIMEDEISENKDDNEEPLPTKETISNSTAGTKRNQKTKKKKTPIVNRVSHIEIEEEHERIDLQDIIAQLLSRKCVDVDEVIPYIERLNHIKQIQRTRGKLYHGKLYQAKQIQENKGATDLDAIFMEEHMKELDDELTRLLDGVILGKR